MTKCAGTYIVTNPITSEKHRFMDYNKALYFENEMLYGKGYNESLARQEEKFAEAWAKRESTGGTRTSLGNSIAASPGMGIGKTVLRLQKEVNSAIADLILVKVPPMFAMSPKDATEALKALVQKIRELE